MDIIKYDNNPITFEFMKKRFGRYNVFISYELPKLSQNNYYIILQKLRNELEGHFVCVLSYEDECYYFDSFGIRPTSEVEKRMKEFSKKCFYSNFDYQRLNSQRCGLYVQYVVKFFRMGYSFEKILDELNKISERHEK